MFFSRKNIKFVCLNFVLMMGIHQAAYADSFCGYDAGLIGTKGIGSIPPWGLKDITIELETYACTVLVYDKESKPSPEIETASQSYPCEDFIHMPSPYVDDYKGSKYQPEGFPIASSEYFRFLVFDSQDDKVLISLRTGEEKWVEMKNPGRWSFPYKYQGEGVKATIGFSSPTQSGIYSEPRFDSPDRVRGEFIKPLWVSRFGDDAYEKFFQNPFFQDLARKGKINIEGQKIGEFVNKVGSGFEIIYDVEEIIRDDEGREWLKASERFSQSVFYYDWKHPSPEDDKNFDGEAFVSDPIRTVYFPYREPSGTITMVMVDGFVCD